MGWKLFGWVPLRMRQALKPRRVWLLAAALLLAAACGGKTADGSSATQAAATSGTGVPGVHRTAVPGPATSHALGGVTVPNTPACRVLPSSNFPAFLGT